MATATSPAEGAGFGTFFGNLAQTLNDAARYRLIDQERIEDQRNIPDRVDVRTQQTATGSGGIGNAFSNLGPMQWAGLAVATGLTFALVTGKFS